MDLLPAIDLRAGAAVRLTQGDFAREERTETRPHSLPASSRAAPAGSTSSTGWGPHRRSPTSRAVLAGSSVCAERSGQRASSAVGSGQRTTPRRCWRPVWRGSSWARRRSRSRRSRAVRVAGPGGSRSGSTTGVDADGVRPRRQAPGLARRVRGSALDRPLGAVGARAAGRGGGTAIGRDGMLSGPDVDGLDGVWPLTAGAPRGGVGRGRRRRAISTALAGLGSPGRGACPGSIVGKALVEGSVQRGGAVWPHAQRPGDPLPRRRRRPGREGRAAS